MPRAIVCFFGSIWIGVQVDQIMKYRFQVAGCLKYVYKLSTSSTLINMGKYIVKGDAIIGRDNILLTVLYLFRKSSYFYAGVFNWL